MAHPDLPPPDLFDCRDEQWSVQLLGADDQRLILFTTPLEPGKGVGNSQSGWAEIREGAVIGQGGGHQNHVRLSDGLRHVILFEGADGALAEHPGRTYAGVIIRTSADPAQDIRISCAATSINAGLIESVRAWSRRVGAPLPQPEDPGGAFDAWF